ncbi:MAG: tetratricopeptide repeat protein [bacterium]|nr:tetratricopeptide repeat protein [bacterium]
MQRNQVALLVTVIIIVIAGYFLVRNAKSPAASPESTTSTSTSPESASTEIGTTTTTITGGGTLGIVGTGGYTVKEISIQNTAPKAPDYNAPLAFSASLGLTADQKSALEARAASLRAQLAKNPFNFTAWLALGTVFKTAGDYAQAATIWTYLTLTWPTDAIALGNLGDLYMNFIKDYPKASASYLGAIKNDSRQINAYRSLFQLYSSLYTPNNSAAEDILKKGIQNNPEALDLYVLLARYYRDTGRIAEAKAEYDMAIVIAKGQTNAGAADILADITAEQAALK